MERYILAPTDKENDCEGCALALACINPCNLPKGMHYIKNPKLK